MLRTLPEICKAIRLWILLEVVFDMDYMGMFLSFISGVLLTLFGTWINTSINENLKASSALKDAEYKMYLKLNDLYNWYFWYATNELHQKKTTQNITDECYRMATELAKLLHGNERTEFAADLMKILYDENYQTYNERWKHMSSLIEKMGRRVVPVHTQRLGEISDSNLVLMAQDDFVAKAPASSSFKMGI